MFAKRPRGHRVPLPFLLSCHCGELLEDSRHSKKIKKREEGLGGEEGEGKVVRV